MKKENSFLFSLSGIACILVVFIHVPFFGYFGRCLLPICRFSVPYFFTLSGYYCKPLDGSLGREKTLKFLRLFIWVWSCYLALSLFISLCEGNTIACWVNDKFSIGNVVALLLFNHSSLLEITSYTADSLWFLLAMAYIYLIVGCFGNFIHKNKWFILCFLGIALIVGHCIFTGHFFSLFGKSYNSLILVDNWLVEGFFFFLMGYTIKSIKNQIKLPKIEKGLFLLVLCFILLGSIVESVLYTSDIYLCSVISVVLIFLYADKMDGIRIPLLDHIGKNLSANVYYWHVFIKALIVFVVGVEFLDTGKNILPLLVISITLCMNQVFYQFKKNLK